MKLHIFFTYIDSSCHFA